MLTDMWMRLRSLFRRNFVEAELDEELQFHFEKQVQKLVAEGFRHAEAQRRARLAIGGTQQICMRRGERREWIR